MNSTTISVSSCRRRTHDFDPINGTIVRSIGSYLLHVLLTRYLEAGKADLAETEKARIEQAQRSRTSAAPSWFKQDGDAFTLIGDEDLAHSYWKKRDEHWQGIEFVDLW